MQTPPAPSNAWLVINLVAQMALGMMAMTICVPSMQDWPALFGASQARVQLTFSGFVAAYGALQLAHGPLSDRLGRKPVLLGGLALCLLGSLWGAAAADLWSLTLARVLQGAGGAAGLVVGRAMVQDLFVSGERTRMMAFVGMTMGVCPPTAMLIGGWAHVRWGWQSGFALIAVLAGALLVAAWRYLPVSKPLHARPWRETFASYVRLTREPAFMLYAVILSTTSATFYAFVAGVPLVLGRAGIRPEHTGWYVMAVPLAYIGGNLLTSRMIGRLGERALMNVGQVLTLAGPSLVLALAFAGIDTPLALALPLALTGIGHGLLVPPTLVGTVGLVPAIAGAAAALAGVMQQMAGASSGFLVGLSAHDGPVHLMLMMLGWTGVGLLAQGLLFGATLRLRPRG